MYVWVGGMGSLRTEALFQCAGLRVMGSCSKLISRLTSWITYRLFQPQKPIPFFFRWNWSWLTLRGVEPIIGYNKKRCIFFKTTTRVHVFIAQYNLKGLCPSALEKLKHVFASIDFKTSWSSSDYTTGNETVALLSVSKNGKDGHMDKTWRNWADFFKF